MPKQKDRELENSILEERRLAAEISQMAKQKSVDARKINQAQRAGNRELTSAKADELWDELLKKANELISSGQNGFDNWVAGMSQIVILGKKLNAAMAASDPIGKLAGIVYESLLAGGYKVKDFIDAATTKAPDNTLPELTGSIEFTDDNQLDNNSIRENLERSDGKPVRPEQAVLVKTAVIAWLKDVHKYEGHADHPDEFYKKQDDGTLKQLTKDHFNDLRDGDKGLNDYLSKRFGMEFKSTPAPRP